MRSTFINTSSLVHAATKEAAETAPKADKAIEKVVYMSADESLKAVVLHVGNAADATLRLIASMVVHLIIRTYHHDETQRRTFKDTKDEMLAAFKEYAETKRGRPFENAWVSRLIQNSILMARSLTSDYAKKGVQPGSPLQMVLRAKTPDKGNEIVMEFVMAKTKGANAFSALEKALAGKKPTRTQPVTAGKTKGSNATKPSTDQPDRIGAAIMADKGHEIFNAVKGNAKAKAIKIADKVGQSNVDHLAFIMRSLSFLSTVEDLMAVAQAATDIAKEMQAKANADKKPRRVADAPKIAEAG